MYHWTRVLKQISILLFIIAPYISLLVLVITGFGIPGCNRKQREGLAEGVAVKERIFNLYCPISRISFVQLSGQYALHVKKYLENHCG